MRKAVFFDRDGVINIDYGFVGKIENYDLVQGVPQALHHLKELGFFLVLVADQSGVARGKYSDADFFNVTQYLLVYWWISDACFDGIYFCPHHPEAPLAQYRQDCECRKPKPGMFKKAAIDLDIDLSQSIMVGDHATDLIAAKNAGISKLYLVGEHIKTEKELIEGCFCYQDLSEMVQNLEIEKK
mgnify:FL=1